MAIFIDYGPDNITIINNILSSGFHGIYTYDVVHGYSYFMNITNNTISDNNYGIFGCGSNCTITDNVINSNGEGVIVANYTTVSYNTIKNNGAGINYGLWIVGDYNTIFSNTFTNNGWYQIHIDTADYNNITNNYIFNNGDNGIQFDWDANYNNITDNNIKQNAICVGVRFFNVILRIMKNATNKKIPINTCKPIEMIN